MPQNYRPKAPPRGITLAETLISSAILGLVLLGVATLISFSIRWNAKMGDAVDVYQQAFRASTRISYDLGTGREASFIYDVDGFAFASARPDSGPFQIDGSGQLVWNKYILYYLDGDNTLYRNEVPIAPPSAAPPSTPDLAILKTQMTGPGMKLAENLSDLEVLPGSGASVKFKVSSLRENPNAVTIQSRMTFRQ